MKITYDPEADALYIEFRAATVTTKHVAEGIAANFDSEGRLAGIEVLDASERLGGKDVFAPLSSKMLAPVLAASGPGAAVKPRFRSAIRRPSKHSGSLLRG